MTKNSFLRSANQTRVAWYGGKMSTSPNRISGMKSFKEQYRAPVPMKERGREGMCPGNVLLENGFKFSCWLDILFAHPLIPFCFVVLFSFRLFKF